MADDSDSRPPSFIRASLKEQVRLASIRPLAPPALLWRVSRWWWATVLRESAPQIALLGALALAFTWVVSLPARLSTAVRVLSGVALIWELRNAWHAHRSVARIDEALEGIETPGPSPRIPRSHLVIPPLAFVTRGVKRTRGIKFAEAEDGTRLRLDIYRPADDDPTDDILHPAVIQVHGGGWLAGSRYEQGIPLLNHLASIGWVGFNIDYRLSPEATLAGAHRRRQARHRLGPRERRGARHRPGDDLHHRWLGGRAPDRARRHSPPTTPPSSPASRKPTPSVAAAVPFYGVYDLTNANGHYYPAARRLGLREGRRQEAARRERGALPRRLTDAPGAPRRAAVPRHPRRPRHARPRRRRSRLRRADASELERARPLRRAGERRARLRPLAVRADGAHLRGDRPLPHRDRRARWA